MRRSLLVAGTALVLAAAVAVLVFRRSDEGATQRARPRRTAPVKINVAYLEEPASLNPYAPEGDSNATRDLLRPVLPTLLRVDPDLRYRPGVAIRVPSGKDVTAEPFSVTIHLDPKARWSDGTPLTAEDVRFTWEVLRNAEIPTWDRSAYRGLKDVTVLGPSSIRLQFDAPYAAWRDLLSAGDFILPKHVLSGVDPSTWFSVPFVSAGPYTVEAWTRGFSITYRANPNWWGPAPLAERIEVFFVPNVSIALQLLEQGRVDAFVSTTQVNLTRRIETSGATPLSRFGAVWWELGFNAQEAGTKSEVHRGAIAAGFDRAGLVEAVVRAEGRPLEHLLPGTRIDPVFARHVFDSARSRSLAKEAGGISPLVLSAPESSEIAAVLERSLQIGLMNSGIKAEVRDPETDDFYSTWLREGRFSIAIWERRGTPSTALFGRYHSSQAAPAGANYSRGGSAGLDAAILAAEGEPTYRAASLNALMNLLADSLPALPLFEAKMFIGVRGVEGAVPNASIDGPFWNLHDWEKK